jgi:hypothetical protein
VNDDQNPPVHPNCRNSRIPMTPEAAAEIKAEVAEVCGIVDGYNSAVQSAEAARPGRGCCARGVAVASDPRRVDRAVKHERGMEFWFGTRQQGWRARYVEQWGVWMDDNVFRPEELSTDDDLDEL